MWQHVVNGVLGLLVTAISFFVTASLDPIIGLISIGLGVAITVFAAWGFYSDGDVFNQTPHTDDLM